MNGAEAGDAEAAGAEAREAEAAGAEAREDEVKGAEAVRAKAKKETKSFRNLQPPLLSLLAINNSKTLKKINKSVVVRAEAREAEAVRDNVREAEATRTKEKEDGAPRDEANEADASEAGAREAKKEIKELQKSQFSFSSPLEINPKKYLIKKKIW